ncbi:MAG: ATP-binding protein, partial [Planctomycetota bacterium]
RYDFAPHLPLVEADATQIRQVIMNLITNASDAVGDSGGTITVRTGVMHLDRDYLTETYLDDDLPEGSYVFVEVTDSGIGMDKETVSKIFDPFFTTKFTGRGLGLAAVLGIVRGHQGAIKVYSEPGRGSTFKVLLPSTEKLDPVALASRRNVTAFHGTGTVLVVDDEESIRMVTTKTLERFGFRVLLAADGQQGVDCFREHADEITLVILDMTMPNMSGDEAFRVIRGIRPDARVILSSGFTEQEATDRFQGEGLAGFIQKPYRPTDLLDKVREVLEVSN